VPAKARTERNVATRERILDAAERLFAEHGVRAVSNRLVAQEAGQGNTAVVGYHFGTKVDLVRAIVARHSGPVERSRERMLAEVEGSTDVRDWVACLVVPNAEHLATLGVPSWFARFAVQVATDPTLRETMTSQALDAATLRRVVDGLDACLPALPPEVRREREDMSRYLLVHVFAERERAVAEGRPTARASWADAATGLVDAVVGVWLAPVTPPGS
jgi:AcrR family transcriptional regulator